MSLKIKTDEFHPDKNQESLKMRKRLLKRAEKERQQEEIQNLLADQKESKETLERNAEKISELENRTAELNAKLENRTAELNAELEDRNKNIQALQDKIKDLLQEIQTSDEQLEAARDENNLLARLIEGYEAKFTKIQESISKLRLTEHDLTASEIENRQLRTNTQDLFKLLNSLKDMARKNSENISFRAAKILQLIHHPEYGRFKDRTDLVKKAIVSFVSKRPFCQDYIAMESILNCIDDGVRAISAPKQRNTYEKIVPPDESVLISVILPVYNQAEYLAESIRSVVCQTYKNWELIVLNDGSQEDIDAVMAQFKNDKRIHYLKQVNQKLPKALSNAFRYASGEFFTWTSADNNMRPEMLARLSAFLRLHSDIDMVYADYAVIGNDGSPFREPWFRPQNKYLPESEELHLPQDTGLLNVIKDNFIGASFMYRRSIQKIIGDYDPVLGVEDYDYWMRINNLFSISHLGTDEILYDYRVHENSLSGKAKEHNILEKSVALMEREKRRFSYYCKPFDVYGNYHDGDLSFGKFFAKLVPGSPADLKKNSLSKQVLLLKGWEIGNYSPEDLQKYDYTAVYFYDQEAKEAARYSQRIRAEHIHCFAAPNSMEAAVLSVFTDNLVECSPGAFGQFALADANNSLFWNKTHSKEITRKIQPDASMKNSDPVIILLENIGTGGMEQVAYDMAASFVSAGRETLFICVKDCVVTPPIPDHVQFIRLNRDHPENEFLEILRGRKFSAVIAHYTTWGASVIHAKHIPFYQVLHNTYAWFGDNEISCYRDNDKFTTGYVAVSSRVAGDAVRRLGISPEKVIIIENGIDFGRYRFDEDVRKKARAQLGLSENDLLPLNPASCFGVKGQLHLIHAFALTAQEIPQLKLIMAGKILEDNYAKMIRNVIAENHLEDRVKFGSHFDCMNELYNACDAVVMSSFWEGCSLAVAEAVQYGMPIISTRAGDVERQTAFVPHKLINLPCNYSTDLRPDTFGQYLYTPNDWIKWSLREAFLALASGELKRTELREFHMESAREAYLYYLRMIDLHDSGFAPSAIRHNLKKEDETVQN